MTAPSPGVRDRHVVLLLAAVALLVLGAGLLSALVPGMDALFARVPILVIVLVIGTVGVLLWSVVRRRRT